MKKAKTILAIITMLFFSTILCGTVKQTVKADDLPVVCLGTSLTETQKNGTLKTLSEPLKGASYQTITITGADLVKYLNPSGANFTTNSGVWSTSLTIKGATILPQSHPINIKMPP